MRLIRLRNNQEKEQRCKLFCIDRDNLLLVLKRTTEIKRQKDDKNEMTTEICTVEITLMPHVL